MHFRLWAPGHKTVAVLLDDSPDTHALTPEGNGYWSLLLGGARPGTRYRYRIDGDG
ncbi:MAG: hypothetical protein H7X95_00545, partial [Deltaproteobacteria bacterium]|nr:hypothetical protein [Deltaproteobacteria bacterium]